MQVHEVEAVLSGIVAEDATRIDVAAAASKLEECFIVLRRETGFKNVPPGESMPLLPYELVQARDAVERAMDALVVDVPEALEHCRTGLSDLQRFLRRQSQR